MTFKYNNVYIKDTAVVAGKFEHEGPMSKYFQDYYDDFYMNAKTWEQAESKMASETIGKITKKNKIDLIIAGDLLNQISASNFAVANFPIPYLGIYNACATATEGLIIASNFVAYVIDKHLKECNRNLEYYDLILTGDLGEFGKKVLKDLMKEEYKIDLINYNDTATMIYDINKQSVYSGGSGPACAPMVTYTYVFDEMLKGNLKRVLLVATGALLSTTSVNQHQTIPAIAHAISLEANI